MDDAIAAMRSGRVAEAGDLVDELVRLDPDRGEGWSLRGLLALDAYGDLRIARESYENALARGASVTFRLMHDHGTPQQFCVGTLLLTPAEVQFNADAGNDRFRAPYAGIREAGINSVYGSQVGMFHLRVTLSDGSKNFNFAVLRSADQRVVNRKPDAELLLHLLNQRRSP